MNILLTIAESEIGNITALKKHKEIYEYLVSEYPNKHAFFSYLVIKRGGDPNTFKFTCEICGSDLTGKSSKKFCSVSCSMKSRYQNEGYSKRVKNSITTSYSKIDPVVLQERSMRIAEIKRERGSYELAGEKISETRTKKKEAKKKLKLEKIMWIFSRFGIERTVLKGFSLTRYKRKTLLEYWAYVRSLKRKFGLVLQLSDDELTNLWHKKYAKKQVCEYCGSDYILSAVSGKGLVYPRGECSKFCSGECSNAIYKSQEYKEYCSARSKKYWEGEEYREKHAIILSDRYKNMPKSKKDERANKAKQTLLEKDPDYYSKWSAKILATKLKNGYISSINEFSETRRAYMLYKNAVIKFTKRNDPSSLPNSEKRGKHSYHLDHIFPTSLGFLLNIPPELIGSIDNLRFIKAKINRKKSNFLVETPEFIVQYIETLTNEQKDLYEDLKNRGKEL